MWKCYCKGQHFKRWCDCNGGGNENYIGDYKGDWIRLL